ncbi:LpqB family beta-propeller domain-containing protein [Paractinoplanes globisporus]|uniref:LpqB family beta-propeller domain-containing protein n=1 Tax=Paractinoplanes globisporus TaxID=113565 RepID=A0ABW6WFR6_9ACTN|nr:LpqB family beta-propeller domain-containing protein [Actinoplanes globisporus]
MRRLLTVAVVAALLLGGCGIPDETRVTVVGAGPSGGTGARDDTIPAVPNTRESANDPLQLLRYYLEAAAGDPETELTRVKAFLAPGARAGFEAGPDVPDVKVIRLKGDPLQNTPDDPEITFNAQVIGLLKGNGSLEPNPEANPVISEYTVKVGRVAGQQGYFILETPPHTLLLTDTALNNYYERRTIYFWNNENTALIPDLRYMPRDLPSTQRPTTIVSWLVSGPASWLGYVAHGLPDGTTAPEIVPAATNNTLSVTLGGPAVPAGDAKALDRLRRQFQWSLQKPGDVQQTLELKIGKQEAARYSETDYRSSNPAYRLASQPERFAVYNGVIRRIAKTTQAEPIPVLKPEDNKGITAAAMSASSTHTFAAVVTGSGKNAKLRVAVAPTGEQAALKDVRGLSGTLGRPVWSVTADNDPLGAVGLITVNNRLYTFAPDGSAVKLVDWQTDPGPIQAISVAPDGYRVALVAGGRLYRATLETGGDDITISTPERLYPPTLSKVTAVAWSSETYLAVAGLRDDGQRYAVLDVSVDGAVPYGRLDDIGKEAVTYLTAYPSNPLTRGENADTETYEAAGDAWDVLGEPVKITVGDLAGPPASPQAGVNPTAPFFLY